MIDLHVDDFYKDVAIIMLQLYSTFPRPAPVYVEDVCGPDEVDEYGLHSARHLACLGTMLWLADEGYLRYEDTIRQEAVDQAVLTHKAFVLLNARHEFVGEAEEDEETELPPSVIARRRTNVFRLNQAVRSESSERIRQVVHYLLARHA